MYLCGFALRRVLIILYFQVTLFLQTSDLESCSKSQTTKIAVSGGCFSLFYVFFFCIKSLSLPEIKKRKNVSRTVHSKVVWKTAWHEIKKENTWMLCNKWNFLPTLSLKNSVNWTLNVLHHMALVSFHSFYILLSTFHLFVVCFVSLSICAF